MAAAMAPRSLLALDGEPGALPLREAVLEAPSGEPSPSELSDRFVGVSAVRTAAVGDDLGRSGRLRSRWRSSAIVTAQAPEM
jgi:hypothetical protein